MTGVDKASKQAGQPSHYLTVTGKLLAVFFSHVDPLISLFEECHGTDVPYRESMVSNSC